MLDPYAPAVHKAGLIAAEALRIVDWLLTADLALDQLSSDAKEIAYEMVMSLLTVEVHATCHGGESQPHAGVFQSVAEFAAYTDGIGVRLAKIKGKLKLDPRNPAQAYAYSLWAAQNSRRMLEAVPRRGLAAIGDDQLVMANLHRLSSRFHEGCLRTAEQLEVFGIESELRRAAELIDHKEQKRKHDAQVRVGV